MIEQILKWRVTPQAANLRLPFEPPSILSLRVPNGHGIHSTRTSFLIQTKSLEICKELITSLLRNWQRNFRLKRGLRFGIHFLTLSLIVIVVVWEPLNRALLHASHNSQKKIDGRKWAIKVNWSKPFKEDHHWIALLFQQLKLESVWMKTKEK